MGRAFLSGGVLVSTKTPFPVMPGYSSSWFPSMPPMSNGWPATYLGIYKSQLWVYVLVNKLAGAEARLPLPVYQRGAKGRTRTAQHPMAQLLSNPNAGLTEYALREWTAATENIFGLAFWWKRRQSGTVRELWPLHPSSMHAEPDGSWTFDNGRTVMKQIPPTDLVQFSRYEKVSPLEPLRATLENEWHARSATSSFWRRGARPGFVLKHPANISEPAQQRLKAQIDAQNAGSENTGSTLLLEEGMEPQTLTLTAEEAQYIETRRINREEACAAYDVPPPVVHILDRATFSNITEQMRSMYRDTMGPPLGRREATIELELRRAEWPDDEVYAEHLLDQILRGDFEARQDALKNADYMTVAEKREIENLPFVAGTDTIFLNSASLPLQTLLAGPEEPQEAPETPGADSRTPPPLRLVRTVLGRLGWQRSLDQVDTEKVCAGLSAEDAAVVDGLVAAEKAANGTVAGLKARLQGKQLELTPRQEKVAAVLRGFFTRQGSLDPGSWDTLLTRDLHRVAVEVSEEVGRDTTKALGFDPSSYNVDLTLAFLLAVAERYAKSVNDTTRTQLTDADPSEVYAKAADSRAPGVALAVATTVAGFAAVEAGKQAAASQGVAPTKTWVTGSNPRSSHAAMNGETVGIDDVFSNGQEWPGGGDVEDIGCNCEVVLNA